MLHIAIYHPQIPQNTGTLLRLGSCFGIVVDLIRPFSFLWDDKYLRRAGMDYLDTVEYRIHESFDAFLEVYGRTTGKNAEQAQKEKSRAAEREGQRRIIALEADNKYRIPEIYHQFQFKKDDIILAGSEHDGFAAEDLAKVSYCVKIPMVPGRRSLNVAIAMAIVTAEAMRQIDQKIEDTSLI